MLKRRKKSPVSRIAIDPGAFRTRFYSATEGLLLDQPSIAALDMDHQLGGSTSVSTFGDQAADILMSRVDGYREVQPVQSDMRNDLGLRLKMLGHFLDQARLTGLTGRAPEVSLLLPHHCDAKPAPDYNKPVLQPVPLKLMFKMQPSRLSTVPDSTKVNRV